MFLSDETRRAQQMCDMAEGFVAALCPGDVPLSEVPGLYERFAQLERVAVAGKTLLTERVAESEVWKRQGHPNAAEYLAKTNGTYASAARAELKTSKRLRALPQTDAALRGGALSAAQAELIADAATHDRASESDLLASAKTSSLSELRQECLRRKAAADADPGETERRIHRERRVRTHTDAEGAWNMSARGTTLAGARIGKALDLITDKLFRQARSEEGKESRDALAFDAFDTMAGWFWDAYHGADPDFDLAGPATSDADETGDADGVRSADNRASDADDVSDADGAGASDVRVGNDTGSAGGVNGQDGDPSRADRDNPVTDDESTDATSSRSNRHNTRAADLEDDICNADTRAGETVADVSERGAVADLFGGSHGHDGSIGENRAERRRGDRSRKKRRAKVNDLVLVHLDWSALVRGHLLGGERCVMPGVGPLSVDAARNLLPEAVVKLVLTDGPTVTNVTHLGSGVHFADLLPIALKPRRQVSSSAPRYLVLLHVDVGGDSGNRRLPGWIDDRIGGHGVDLATLSYTGRGLNAAQRTALLWSQPLCSVEGCNRYRVEYDHRTPWATVHETHVDNIDPLCGQHHRLKSTKGWALVEGTGKRPFVPPTDARHPHAQRRARPSAAA